MCPHYSNNYRGDVNIIWNIEDKWDKWKGDGSRDLHAWGKQSQTSVLPKKHNVLCRLMDRDSLPSVPIRPYFFLLPSKQGAKVKKIKYFQEKTVKLKIFNRTRGEKEWIDFFNFLSEQMCRLKWRDGTKHWQRAAQWCCEAFLSCNAIPEQVSELGGAQRCKTRVLAWYMYRASSYGPYTRRFKIQRSSGLRRPSICTFIL